jgi:hypothetical protein
LFCHNSSPVCFISIRRSAIPKDSTLYRQRAAAAALLLKGGSMQPLDPSFGKLRTDFEVTTLGLRVWRDFALLAAEGLAIGVVASAMFALAVFAVVR